MESARNLTRVSQLVCTCAVASVASKAASLVGLGSCGGQESRFLTRWTLLFYYKDEMLMMKFYYNQINLCTFFRMLLGFFLMMNEEEDGGTME